MAQKAAVPSSPAKPSGIARPTTDDDSIRPAPVFSVEAAAPPAAEGAETTPLRTTEPAPQPAANAPAVGGPDETTKTRPPAEASPEKPPPRARETGPTPVEPEPKRVPETNQVQATERGPRATSASTPDMRNEDPSPPSRPGEAPPNEPAEAAAMTDGGDGHAAEAVAPAAPPSDETVDAPPVEAEDASTSEPDDTSLVPSHVESRTSPRGRSALWVASGAAVAALVGGGIWIASSSSSTAPQASGAETSADGQQTALSETALSETAPSETAPSEASLPPAGPAPSAGNEAPAPSAGEAAPSDGPDPMVADSDEDVSVQTVTIRVHPDGSRIVEKSKVIGGSELVVQLKPGQKRVFEIQHDGYSARRLVVDGAESEIRVGLVRSPNASPAPQPEATAPTESATTDAKEKPSTD